MKNRKMKKIFVSTVLLLLICSMIGCGEYTEAIKKPNGTTVPDESTTVTPPSDTVPDENAYTVSLRYNGDPYIPKDKVFAHWTDGYSFYNAEFNEQGIASVGDLDGNYDVTLSAIPDGLVYNPNIYVATADERNVVIDLYDITEPAKGTGKSLYRCFELEDIGVFRADIKKANTVVYYQFVPSEEGTYVVESWVDITAGEINPKADLYNGTFASKFFDRTLDEGGASKGYTKNFRYEINVDADMIGNVYTFAIHVETKSSEFSPVSIDFAISRNGSYVRPRTDKAMEIPTELYATINRELDKLLALSPEDYSAELSRYAAPGDPTIPTSYEKLKNYENEDPTNPNERLFKVMSEDEYYSVRLYLKNLYNEEGRLTYPEIRVGGKNIFDGSMFKLNPEDGFYHLYDEEKYADTDGYGPTVYAAVTTPCRFLQLSLTHIEDPGNKSLTIRVEENGEYLDHNYKHFLEGYDDLATWSGSIDVPPYYCSYKCPCHGGGKLGLACAPGCENCISDCTPCHKELIGGPGYADFVNRDGYFPLTEELRVFLQRLSESQRYFNDGAGWVEENDVIDVDAMQDDQWLFACAYYTE